MRTARFRSSPLDVSTSGKVGGGVGPQVNKLKHVSSDDHLMSVAGGGGVVGLVFSIMGNGHIGTSPSS